RRRKKLDILALRRAHATSRTAENAGGPDADEKDTLEGRIAADESPVHHICGWQPGHVRSIGGPLAPPPRNSGVNFDGGLRQGKRIRPRRNTPIPPGPDQSGPTSHRCEFIRSGRMSPAGTAVHFRKLRYTQSSRMAPMSDMNQPAGWNLPS